VEAAQATILAGIGRQLSLETHTKKPCV
jgi:hypothetical protein